MKKLLSSALVLLTFMVFTSCNSSSSGGSKPAVPPTPVNPADVNLNQLDTNEQNTTALTQEEQDVAFLTITDIGRASYLNSTAQDANDPNKGQQIEVPAGFVEARTNEPQPNENKFYGQEQTAQSVLADVTSQQNCNPQFKKDGTDENATVTFTTTGAQCPMVMQSTLNFRATNTGARAFDIATNGSLQFTYNENVSQELKNQDLVSGEIQLKATMKMKFPDANEASSEMSNSASATYDGRFVSKRIGPFSAVYRSVFASQTVFSQNQQQAPKMVARGLHQIDIQTAQKRAVLTIKLDTESTKPVSCTLNKKEIDLQTCETVVSQFNMSSK